MPLPWPLLPVTDWRYYDTVYTERYMLTRSRTSAATTTLP